MPWKERQKYQIYIDIPEELELHVISLKNEYDFLIALSIQWLL